jgi:hypothetical protein
VPERPVGLSLIDLSAGNEGKTIWRFVANTDDDGKQLAVPGSVAAPTWQALYVLHWDPQYAYWFRLNPEETHLVIDSTTGKLLREQSLIRNGDYRQWDPKASRYSVHQNVNIRDVRELSTRNQLEQTRSSASCPLGTATSPSMAITTFSPPWRTAATDARRREKPVPHTASPE